MPITLFSYFVIQFNIKTLEKNYDLISRLIFRYFSSFIILTHISALFEVFTFFLVAL